MAIFFAIVPAYLLGKLGEWLGGFVSARWERNGQWLGWLLVGVLFFEMIRSFARYERRQRQRIERDLEDEIVQDIHVVSERVIEIGLINDNEPILAIQFEHDKILYLQGQWLRDPQTYAVEGPIRDPHERFLNGFPEPYSFPSSEFTISRLPCSGQTLGIRVSGRYVEPESIVEALKFEYEFGDSELFEGSLDDIACVLAREHARRLASPLSR